MFFIYCFLSLIILTQQMILFTNSEDGKYLDQPHIALNITNIILTQAEPKYITVLRDIEINNGINICVPNIAENFTLELYFPLTTNLEKYFLYDGDDNLLGSLNEITNYTNKGGFGVIVSKSGCFTISNIGDKLQSNVILFRWKEAQIINCFYENILVIDNENTNQVGSNTAAADGDCETIILAFPNILGIYFTQSSPSSYHLCTFKSTLNNNVFIKLNDKDVLWDDYRIYSPAISVIIPKLTAINLMFKADNGSVIDMHEYLGIVNSPSYSGIRGSSSSPQPLYSFKWMIHIDTFYLLFDVEKVHGKVVISSDLNGNYTLTSADNGNQILINGTNIMIYGLDDDTSYFLLKYAVYLFRPLLTIKAHTVPTISTSMHSTQTIQMASTTSSLNPSPTNYWNISSTNISIIILNVTSPRYVFSLNDIPINNARIICIQSNETLTLIFPTNRTEKFILFDGYDFTDMIGPLNSIASASCNSSICFTFSKSGCFTLLNTGDITEYNIVVFQWQQIVSKHCPFMNALLLVHPTKHYFRDLTASVDGDCEVIVMAVPSNNPTIKIVQFITGSTDEKTYYTFKSAVNGKVYFKTNSEEWTDMIVQTPALIINIPASSYLYIDIDDGGSSTIISLEDPDTKGVLISPSYSGMKLPSLSQPIYTIVNKLFQFDNTSYITFYPRFINGHEIVTIINDDKNGKNYTFASSSIGKSYNLPGINLKVFFTESNPQIDSFLIEYTFNWGQSSSTKKPNLTSTLPTLKTTISTTFSGVSENYKFSAYFVFFYIFLYV